MTSIKSKIKKEISFERPNYKFHECFYDQLSFDGTIYSGRRYYTVDGNIKLPSVTTVLSNTLPEEKKKVLENWKNKIGEEKAEQIKNDAAERGTLLHDTCENFILGDFTLPEKNTNAYALFKQIYPYLKRIDNIHNLEGTLYSKKLGMAGKVDCVAEFDGVLSIIDFKTSTKEKEEDWITDYFLQETAYALMFSEIYGIKPKQLVTLIAKDYGFHEKEGQIFIKKPVDFVEPLLKRVKKFKTIDTINNM